MARSASSGGDDDWIWDHFQSKPKQFIAERDVYHILLENGDCYVFKPARDEDPDYERPAYVPRAELTAYNIFKRLQGKYIPFCYGLLTLHGQVGLLLENCGRRTFEYPPQDDENAKFILFLRAMCAMERCMAAGLVHQDPDFRNIVYDPVTLLVRIIDIDMPQHCFRKPADVWAYMDAHFSTYFGYRLQTSGFLWGLTSIINILVERPCDLSLYLLILHYCYCLVKKKMIERFTPSKLTRFLRKKP